MKFPAGRTEALVGEDILNIQVWSQPQKNHEELKTLLKKFWLNFGGNFKAKRHWFPKESCFTRSQNCLLGGFWGRTVACFSRFCRASFFNFNLNLDLWTLSFVFRNISLNFEGKFREKWAFLDDNLREKIWKILFHWRENCVRSKLVPSPLSTPLYFPWRHRVKSCDLWTDSSWFSPRKFVWRST